MKRVAIVGGGIAGLSAAYYLQKAKEQGAEVEYVLFEAGARLGGVVRTERSAAGSILEAGPDSFLTAKPAAAELARELGLGEQLVASNDQWRKTYVLLKGELVEIPEGLQFMVPGNLWSAAVSPLFSLRTKLRMARECVDPPAPLADEEDESVGDFVRRHFNQELVERLAAPLLAGVYGGDVDRLSARAVLPMFVEMEKNSRSLVRGAIRLRSAKRSSKTPLFTTFRDGMQSLVDAIVERLDAGSLRRTAPVQAVLPDEGGWRMVAADPSAEIFDELILGVPAQIAGSLLPVVDEALAKELSSIPYASSTVVLLEYSAAQMRLRGEPVPEGFGFLVPKSEGRHLFACTFVHNKFPGRAAEDRLVLRAFLAADAAEVNESAVAALVERELGEILGISTLAEEVRVFHWRQAMAQYEVGHKEKLKRVESLASRHRGLHLAGNAYHGIGLPDCIRTGREAAERITAR